MRLPSSSRLVLAALTLIALLGLLSAKAIAHCNGPPAPPLPTGPLPVQTEWIYPLRWSWLHWWEANRDLYVTQAEQKVSQEVQPDVVKAARAKAVAVLSDALDSPDWQVRAYSAYALGQIREQTALPALTKLAQGDSRPEVRQMATLAVGLLDSPEAEEAVAFKGKVPDLIHLARVRALGLLSKLLAATIKPYNRIDARFPVPISAARVWMLSQVEGAATADFFLRVLQRTDNAWLASEAMLALGRTGNKQAVPILADILLATERGKTLPSWRRLESIRLEKLEMAGVLKNLRVTNANTALQRFYQEYIQRFAVWHNDSLAPHPPDAFDQKVLLFTIRLGWEEIYQGNLRAAAAIALGEIDSPQARQALVLALQQQGDEFGGMWQDVNALARAHEFSNLHKGMAVMSLARQGDAACLDALTATLAGNIVMKLERPAEELANSPLRGYAALALGLYARPVETPQGQVDRPGFDRVCELLGTYATNPNETSEVRCAATLALGLTGRTANLRLFTAIHDTAERLKDGIQIGYSLLARAMLGDTRIIEPVKALLELPEMPDSLGDVLARRAAVLALGVAGAQESIPVLNAAWHQSYYVNREIAYALSLCRAYSTTDALVQQLDKGENYWVKCFGARCLADLFMPDGPRRVARLLNRTNYAMRNNSNLFFLGVANEFLMYFLIPSFGETWY